MTISVLKKLEEKLEKVHPFLLYGHVTRLDHSMIEGYCPQGVIGSICQVFSPDQAKICQAEIIGFRDDKALLMPLGDSKGLGVGSRIFVLRKAAKIGVGSALLGRVLDPLGDPLDGKPPPSCEEEVLVHSYPVNPLQRERITEILDVGVRSINSLLTIGKGQRVCIMSGSGTGKSVLLGMMAQGTRADVNVIALIGERGREVREFIEKDLTEQGLSRSVVICATSDVPAVLRLRAAFVAATIAEHFRQRGKDVLFLMDSVTRLAMAQREIGLASGEPPTTKGYPPSVFSLLPKLFERAGKTGSLGSITGLYTVLVEADDFNDPVGDTVRSLVDGHIVLSRKLAARNHYPAIDVSLSISRLMNDIISSEHLKLATRVRSILADYAEAADLINIGAYVKGSNKAIDEAIEFIELAQQFLKQPLATKISVSQGLEEMAQIFETKK